MCSMPSDFGIWLNGSCNGETVNKLTPLSKYIEEKVDTLDVNGVDVFMPKESYSRMFRVQGNFERCASILPCGI